MSDMMNLTRYGSKKMKAIILRLAKKHGVDLAAGGGFRLDMPGYDRLVVEGLGDGRVSIAHYFQQNGDLIQDPEIVFKMTDDAHPNYRGTWLPVEITQVLTGWRRLSGGAAVIDAARFASMWAENIRHQGWLDVETPTWKKATADAPMVNPQQDKPESFPDLTTPWGESPYLYN